MPHDASPHPRILLACTEDAEAVLRRSLAALDARLVVAHDLDSAMREMERGADLVVCTLLFDESRMLELEARAAVDWPNLPFICCSVLSDLPAHALEAAFAVAGLLGAVATVDLPQAGGGEALARAEEALRCVVAGHLHDIGHASMS